MLSRYHEMLSACPFGGSVVISHYTILNTVHTINNFESFDFVAKTGNSVEATCNKAGSCFEHVASILLLVWTGL